jgi:hypothetical protein
MTTPLVFISYRHGPRWTFLAQALHLKLEAVSEWSGFDLFLDSDAIRAGEDWKRKVDAALESCSHFVALLTDDYWVRSNECLRELYWAVDRWEASGRGSPRLLFVHVVDLPPSKLVLDSARQRGELKSDEAGLRSLGQINFLGPFDEDYRLVTIDERDPYRFDKQLAQLRDRLIESGGIRGD